MLPILVPIVMSITVSSQPMDVPGDSFAEMQRRYAVQEETIDERLEAVRDCLQSQGRFVIIPCEEFVVRAKLLHMRRRH